MASHQMIVRAKKARETTDYVRYDESVPQGTDPALRNVRIQKRDLMATFGHVPGEVAVKVELPAKLAIEN